MGEPCQNQVEQPSAHSFLLQKETGGGTEWSAVKIYKSGPHEMTRRKVHWVYKWIDVEREKGQWNQNAKRDVSWSHHRQLSVEKIKTHRFEIRWQNRLAVLEKKETLFEFVLFLFSF